MKKQSAGRRVRGEKIRRKKMQVREKVGKSRNTVFFRGFVAPEGWKVGSLKAAGAETSGEMRNQKLHAVVGAKPISKWKGTKHPQCRTTFGSWDVEKVHTVVARSTFRSQNVKNTRGSDHSWRFRCRFASLHYTTGHYTTLHSSTLHYTTLHSSTLHYTKLHYTTLHFTEWRCNTDRQVDS